MAMKSVVFLALCGLTAGVSPLGKAIELLTGMLEQSKKGRQEEAVQWSAYKQFCTDEELQKQTAVQDADVQIEKLKADVQKYDAEVERLGGEITGHEGDIEKYNGELKNAKGSRKDERVDYEKMHKDYEESIQALNEAINVMRKQDFDRTQATALLESVKAQVKVPEAARRAIDTFLAQDPEETDALSVSAPEANAYEFQSGGVVTLLKELLEKFQTEKLTLEKQEMENRHGFEGLALDLSASTSVAEREIAKKTDSEAKNKQNKVDAASELGEVTAMRTEDAKYLEELATTCNQKSDAFEERQKLRAEEIEAIEKAVEILSSDKVSGAADKHLPSMLQQHRGTTLAQLRSSSRNPHQEQAAKFLRNQADQIGSPALSALALRMEGGEDPFAKVKEMIQTLIDRLKEEAEGEAQHKEWCDEELSTNEHTRTSKSSEVEELHGAIEQLEAELAVLGRDTATLSKQVAELAAAMAKQTKFREEEKNHNEDTIMEASDAQVAVGQAVKVLQDFYAKAGDATALVQSKLRQAPTVFDDAYKGNQEGNNNVIPFLQVLQSDFARLEQETTDAENKAQTDYDDMMTETTADKDQKDKDIKSKKKEQQEKEQDLIQNNEDLTSAQSQLDAALAYFDKLKPSCINTATPFEDRQGRRKEEISSLKEALAILSGETIVDGGPQAMYSSVDGGNRGRDVGITANL